MTIRHLQLNSSVLRDPKAIAKFMTDNSIDVACLQEIAYPIGSSSPLPELLGSEFNYVEGVHYHHVKSNQSIGVAVISKFPIVDVVRLYYNTSDYSPKTISENDNFVGTIINDSPQDIYQGSRGIRHAVKSRCILSVLVQTSNGLLRVVTTHFTVSDVCTETMQMFEMSQLLKSFVKNATDVPTIFSGDLNIRAQSYSVEKIKEELTCHTEELTDTLSKTHIAKKTDFPSGLAIDHVFSKNLKHLSTRMQDVDFSEHKALVSEFEQ
ncbi:hypothetical protein CO180_03075 [candidate division WWE3 bacterium CG_4_9_14_3_um_filter_41_6]|uniref:Endonuclease/exonuclease/phosphatase domain-containing protein n=1 Tax=candidate division WWE3 bacterium CG_4_10_14_0_2_um_filter_41_14 TaxID=1975072 RepID=A0A2M7TG30_UNCKA|nr:MAG: hypothetical protein COY32_05785 [candidate division WWE3 bacterium CG_4_10_14_0_2_um_filter_41_14]PJA38632.1 MAG: hypothetical protein CO180_03075 [candidate division WWE3 bacterium CG_4_9_14_3_um_filter_41_6]